MSLYGSSMIEAVARRETTTGERRLAFLAWSVAILACLALGPVRAIGVGPVTSFLPAVASASLVTMLSTAAILRFRYRASGDPTLAALGVAYAFAAATTLSYAIAFSRGTAVAPADPTSESLASWYWLFGHAGFLVAIAGYRAIERRRDANAATTRATRGFVRRYVTAAALATCVALAGLLAARGVVPVLNRPDAFAPLFRPLVRCFVLAPSVALFGELVARTRLRRSPDLWLALVITLAFTESYVGGELATRPFSLAWYAGGFAGLGAGSIFLAVQMRIVFELLRAFAAHNRSLAQIARYDALTGLLNRGAFESRFEALWNQCRRVREPISLLVLDLDFFKRYNDHFGHVAGDEALRRIARELAGATTRPTDLTCRIGGEEFAIVLPFTDERGAAVVAERIIVRVRDLAIPHAPDLVLSRLTVSVGAATSHGGSVPHGLLFEHADAALYHAKATGRDRVGSVRAAATRNARAG